MSDSIFRQFIKAILNKDPALISIGRRSTVVTVLTLLLLHAEYDKTPGGEVSIRDYDWRVVRIFPHDPEAFTQGLLFRDGYLYESTGRRGKSTLRKVRLESGEVIRQVQVEDEYFAEGLTVWNDRLIQLTLSSETGFAYDLNSFERIAEFGFEGEGWGLTSDSRHLIMSDGTAVLRFLNPETFVETRRVQVTENGKPVSRLNELEMIGGKVFANVLPGNRIVEIDPETGNVTGRINLENLVTSVKRDASVNVLNGIAYDVENDRIFVTGKLWPNLFEIEIR